VLTAIPLPPKESVAFGPKFVPVTVKFGMIWPRVPDAVDIEEMEGGGAVLEVTGNGVEKSVLAVPSTKPKKETYV